jgi:ribonuclease P protein component
VSTLGGGPDSTSATPAAGKPNEALPRDERVLDRADFLRAQSRGRRLHGEHFVWIVFARGDDKPTRIGVTVSRKVGNSVVRHRVKRWVREVFRRSKSAFPQNCDVIAIAREGKVPASLDAVKSEILALFASSKDRGRSPNRQGGTGARERSDAKHRGR